MSMSTQHITLMAGGTGGHIMPALAVAEELRHAGHGVSWLGSIGGMEEKLVSRHAIDFYGLPIKGLRSNGLLGWLAAPFRILRSVSLARKMLQRHTPNCVLSMGGFAAGPGGLAARSLGIPLIVHEQNKIPGLTNKVLARIATIVCQGFADSFPVARKALTVGNPVRRVISDLPKRQVRHDTSVLNVLVLGGSQGAKALNEAMPGILVYFDAGELAIRHQCGQRWLEQTEAHYAAAVKHVGNHQISYQVEAFIDDMAAAYQWADLVVARAGAMTISELACAGSASVLVPYPYAVDDHQTANAGAMRDAGAAIVITESQLQDVATQTALLTLIGDASRLESMADAAHGLAKPEAASAMAEICLRSGSQSGAATGGGQ